MAALRIKVGDDMGAIRVEAAAGNEMGQIYSWLARNRGQVVPLDGQPSVTLGVPISGARAVIVAAALENGMGGVLRAVSNPGGGPVRLVYDIRSKGGLGREVANAIGIEVVAAISRLIADETLVAEVA